MVNCASRHSLIACALVLAHATLAACTAVDTSSGKARSDDEDVGHLNLALTGGSASGDTYRLRDGSIELLGTSSAMFSTEDYLDQSVIQMDLPAGGYLARLLEGWRLERAVGDGSFEDVPARLISTNPLPFEVFDQQVTNVVLRFQAGEEIIELGNGRLLLSIFVEDGMAPPPSGDCVEACVEAEFLGCVYQDMCVEICENLPGLVQTPECMMQAEAYVNCAMGQPGMSYVCSYDYPVAGACEPVFQSVIDCILSSCTDMDGDGSCQESGDCDDGNPAVSPNMPEVCDDGLDNDCDGTFDGGDADCGMAPMGWNCPPGYYGTGDGCDCGCGILDPDCVDASVDACQWCDDPGSCSTEPGCPGTINPMDNASCL